MPPNNIITIDLCVLQLLMILCTVVYCTACTFIRCVAGKILEDSKVISDYKIEEKNFVVVMVTKVPDLIVVVCE